jgi:glycosyltransferase involved in cell wall biosynthesis
MPAVFKLIEYVAWTILRDMKVLVDCTQITKNKAGVGAYALNLTRELVKRQDETLEVTLLIQDDDPDFSSDGESIRLVKVPAKLFRSLPFRFLMEQLYIPWLIRKHNVDVLHSLHYSFPLLPMRARKIVTVHDLTSVIMPEVHTYIKRAYCRFFIRAANRFADALIFVSNSTKEDWTRHFQRISQLSFVIPLGKAGIFRPGLSPEQIDLTLQKYKIDKPFLLYIGTIEPRKNLTRLVEAFSQLTQSFPMHNLVIAGMKGWMYDQLFDAVRSLELQTRVIFTGFVAEEDKPYLISGAEVFVYPSLYEGFGIPALEAISCGTPTLTSNVSSLPEVVGDAALLVDPRSVNDIAFNLSRLLTDEDLRDSLCRKSVYQASLFEWGRTADETIHAYRMVALT